MTVSKPVLDELREILRTDASFWQDGPIDHRGIFARESGIYARSDGFYLVYSLVGYAEPVRVVKIEGSRTLPGERVVYLTLENGVGTITIMSVHALVLAKTREHYQKMHAVCAASRLRAPADVYAKTIDFVAKAEGLTRIGP